MMYLVLKTWRLPAILLAAALFFICGILPRATEMRLNRVDAKRAISVGDKAAFLHERLLIADMHTDSLLFHRDLGDFARRGHLDFPRMRQGRVAIQVFSVVSKTPHGLNYDRNDANSDDIRLLAIAGLWPPRTWSSLRERALHQAFRLAAYAADSKNEFVQIRSKGDLEDFLHRRQTEPRLIAGMLSAEGAHPLEGKLENINAMYDAGYRMIGLVHFFDNELGGSAHGVHKGGLTPFGRDVVHAMENRSIIVDLAHASPELFADVLAMAARPVVVSHTGVKGTCDNVRNLSDKELRAVAKNGGLIGIGFWETAVCDKSPRAIARAIHYAAKLAGSTHVSLGSDWDGATTVPFDAAHIVQLVQALLDEGLSEGDIAAVMGENLQAFLRANLPEK